MSTDQFVVSSRNRDWVGPEDLKSVTFESFEEARQSAFIEANQNRYVLIESITIDTPSPCWYWCFPLDRLVIHPNRDDFEWADCDNNTK